MESGADHPGERVNELTRISTTNVRKKRIKAKLEAKLCILRSAANLAYAEE